ncbi:MAG: CCA tRNA nucleotidyltransferase [Verrucomicrobiia bacterium]
MSLESIALKVVQRLQDAGFEAFWVGGCVRDFLLGRPPKDYDVATSARPEQIEALFSQTVPVGRQFGVLLVLEQGFSIQVATFRAESDYQDGRHPSQISFANARADAVRRDFTINGMFYDPIRRQTHDWVEGLPDLRAKVLRTIGSPAERFAEDHLRLLRAVRLAAELGFTIEPATFAALRQLAHWIETVSAERVRDELLKLFRPPHAARGLELLRETGLLDRVLPELSAAIACEQSPEYHPEGTVYDHVRLMLDKLPLDAPLTLPWAVLLHDIAKPVTSTKDPGSGAIHFYGHEKVGAELADAILRRLKFPRRQIEDIVACVRHHMRFKDVPQMRKSTVRRMLLRPTFTLELELHRLDCLGSHGSLDIYDALVQELKALEAHPEMAPPLLTGDDLIAMGMAPGPAMGALLRQIREKQLQEELKNPDEARVWAAEQIRSRGEQDGA